MSINVYLNDSVEKLEGFETKDRKSKDGQCWQTYHLPGLQFFRDGGRWYFVGHELTDPIPAVVKGLVNEISFYGQIPWFPQRSIGIYRYEDAEAEIDYVGEIVRIRMCGKSMENMLELYRKIRAGKITPRESWYAEQESSQVKKSRGFWVLRVLRRVFRPRNRKIPSTE